MSNLIYVGMVLFFVGWIWNIVVSFKMGGTLWGILNIFLQPIVGIISAFMQKTSWTPVGVMILGMLCYFVTGGMSMMGR